MADENQDKGYIEKASEWVDENPETAAAALIGTGGVAFVLLITR